MSTRGRGGRGGRAGGAGGPEWSGEAGGADGDGAGRPGVGGAAVRGAAEGEAGAGGAEAGGAEAGGEGAGGAGTVSLGDVLNKKAIKDRKKILGNFLKENDVGKLSEENSDYFRHIFQQFYSPDEGEEKYENKDILEVKIGLSNWGDKCFVLHHAESPKKNIPAGIKYLAGAQRSKTLNFAKAARVAIQPQIDKFKKETPLNASEMCPLGHGEVMLGMDAQVDHVTLFKVLLEEWKQENGNKDQKTWLKTTYNLAIYDHEFVNQEALESWRNYHINNASLRWLSKTANQRRSKL